MSVARLAAAVLFIAPLAAHAALSQPGATTLVDGSFEAKGASVTAYCYDGFSAGGNAPCVASPWTGSGVIHSGNGAWGGTTTPFGSTFAFVQSTDVLSQTFTAASSGTLKVTWDDAGRTNYGGSQSYTVSVAQAFVTESRELIRPLASPGSFDLGTFTTNGGGFTARSGTPFTVIAGDRYTLNFTGLSTDDRTSFIDNVSLGAVPEPTTWAMLLAGFGLVGVAARRRAGSAVAA